MASPPKPLDRPSRPRATGRTTLADVARLAEVSPITVSRALRGERAVDPSLVARVKAAAERLGYVPDPAARALASRHSTHVALLVPLLSNTLFVDLLEAAQRRLRSAGYQTLIGITHYDRAEEEQLLREQLLHRPAGLLVTGLDQSAATRALIQASGVPCVHLMETVGDSGRAADAAAGADAPPVYCVGFSQADAAATLTQHLLAQGRRRIAFAGAQLDPRVMQRLAGWRRCMQAAGQHTAALEWLNPAPSSQALGAQLLAQILAQQPAGQPPVDAIFFCNDDLAQGALLAAARQGLAVPGRLAVAGFNDLTGSDQMLPPLTTVRTPRSEIGRVAAEMLLTLMRGDTPPQPSIDLGYTLVVRESA